MAKTVTNINEARWNSALFNHQVATLAWSAVELEGQCPARKHAKRALKKARKALFAVPALNLGGVVEKLLIFWGEELFIEDHVGSVKQKVIGDLRRIGRKDAGIEEAEASGRTPEEAAELADKWRAAYREYHDHEMLLTEGSSPTRDQSEVDDIVDAMFQATDILLDLPAPTIRGVAKKLQLLWEKDKFDTVSDEAFLVRITHDLNRLSTPTYRPGDDLD